ncbi:TonB-dependent receptor [Novosphingobium flavum]|uniref:TonB-dependent receptor n=1 Tax=Novosphingobium flavum TaxID=1778672 RepID=A0A7X1KM70_9SPHN|nr:TonB-dependent receptor [Novosphingobium flavum]MBC2666314.1 TonB-dependent receptor [Novosphingobium flavum]
MMARTFRTTLAVGVAFAALNVMAGPALAQDAPAETNLDSQEIIVTATKTETVASKTPIALSVFKGDDLTKRGVVSVADLQNVAPALNVGSAARGANITIRGVGTTDITSKGEQGVSFNIDGVPTGVPQIMSLGFLDLERVEVLRGPQGTLYGKSSTGGAINLITAKPKDTLEASASVELGNFNTRRGEAMVNIPLGDTFAVRAAAVINNRDGYILPTINAPVAGSSQRPLKDENNWMTRLTGLARLGDLGDITLSGTFGHVGGAGSNGEVLWYRALGQNMVANKAARTVYYNPYATGVDDNFSNITGIVNLDLGGVKVTYTGAHIHLDTNDNPSPSVTDPAGSGGIPNYTWTQYQSWVNNDSHEIRFSNAQPGRLTWVLGANYVKETINEIDLNWQTQAGTISLPDGTPNNPNDNPKYFCATPNFDYQCNSPNPQIIGPSTHQSKGVFGQASFAVSETIKLTAGGRYSDDKSSRNYTIAAGPAPGADYWSGANGLPCRPGNPCIGTKGLGLSQSGKFTWRLGIDFTPAPNQLIYASVATGYKGGSFNDFDPTTKTTKAYGPESLIAYEIGYKGRPVANLQFNSALYYYDYKHYQLTGATFIAPSVTGGPPVVVIFTTTPPAKFYGWENELTWTPTSNDTLNLSFALAGGEFGKGAKAGFLFLNQVSWEGKRPDSLATFSGTASYEHRFELANGGNIAARIGTKFSNGYFLSDLGGQPGGDPTQATTGYSTPPQQYRQGGFTRTDVNLGYTSENGKLSLSAYVRNIENKFQFIGAPNGMGTGSNDRVFARVSDPRTFGVRLGVKY